MSESCRSDTRFERLLVLWHSLIRLLFFTQNFYFHISNTYFTLFLHFSHILPTTYFLHM